MGGGILEQPPFRWNGAERAASATHDTGGSLFGSKAEKKETAR
jgi:hypothetical protein